MIFGLNKNMKKLFVSIVLLFAVSSLFAVEEYVSLIYKQIDEAFTSRSADKLDEILKDNITDKYYYLIENYTQKKIRRLILTNDYQFAQDTTLVVIDNNLDNTDAVEMYSLIIDAYEIQKDAEAKKEQARIEAEQRVEKEKEKARSSTEKLYEGTTTASGRNIYMSSEKDMNFIRYEWKGQLGLFNMEHVSDQNALKGGLSALGSYEYNFRNFTVGGDAFFGFIGLFNFAGTDKSMGFNLEFIPKISMTNISRKLFLRLGLFGSRISDGLDESSVRKYASPVLGVQYDDIKIGRMSVFAGVDVMPINVIPSNLSKLGTAVGFNLGFEIPFSEYDRTAWYFMGGIKDKYFLMDRNELYVVLGIGAKNVIR